MSGATNNAGAARGTWPADVIHVNEDGWVLVNRGRSHGVFPGLRLLVVGTGIRVLHDLFAGGSDSSSAAASEPPVVLRTRRTYEQLEVVYAEDTCAVAIATRTLPERRPTFYRGPDGELLVWVPLPEGFTYPQPGEDADDTSDYGASDSLDASSGATSDTVSADGEASDIPPEHSEQDDERWEEALPLNGVAVGDLVVPAIPVGNVSAPATASADVATSPSVASEPPANPFESGRSYDWMDSQ